MLTRSLAFCIALGVLGILLPSCAISPTTSIPPPIAPTRAATVPAATALLPSRAATVSVLPLSPTQLKYRLAAEFGKIFFCDRDVYPIGREVSDQEIAERVAQLQQNVEEYQAILEHLQFENSAALSPVQKRAMDDERKMLEAIQLQPEGNQYSFHLQIADDKASGFAIEGTLSNTGAIAVTKREPIITTCPICLDGATRIDTANGALPVRELKTGMRVWTLDARGTRTLAVIVGTVKRSVPMNTSMVHLVLADGRALIVSANHPTTDGRIVGDLARGEIYDGARVVSVERVPLNGDETYDILPAGETGAYWANGVLLASTLAR